MSSNEPCCSFCGKSLSQVKKLIGRPAKGRAGEHGEPLICDGCIRLGSTIVEGAGRAAPVQVGDWHAFTDGSERFEWELVAQPEGQLLVIRHAATGKSVCFMLPLSEVVTEQTAMAALARMRDRLA